MNQKKLRVLMLGSSLNQNGGIASVEKLILHYATSEVEIQHITTHDEGSIIHRGIVFGKSIGIFLWQLVSREIELVHIHISEKGSVLRKVIVTLIAFMFRKPVLIHAHGAEFHVFFLKLPVLVQKLLRLIFSRCTGFIVLSKTWQEFYVQHLNLKPEKVFILPNSIELPTEVPQRTNVKKVSLIFLGRIGQRKGAFDLLRAFANLPDEQKDCSELILAGDGEIEQGRQLAESLGIIECVTFAGWVNSEQRNQLLAAADIFVLPSYNEGLPMALLEAMAWGLPAIATPVGGIPEVISCQNGLLINPGDILSLSQAMQSLIAEETMRLSMGKAARQSVIPFDIKTYSCRLVDIYRLALESN